MAKASIVAHCPGLLACSPPGGHPQTTRGAGGADLVVQVSAMGFVRVLLLKVMPPAEDWIDNSVSRLIGQGEIDEKRSGHLD